MIPFHRAMAHQTAAVWNWNGSGLPSGRVSYKGTPEAMTYNI